MVISNSEHDKKYTSATSGRIYIIKNGPYKVTGSIPLREKIISDSQGVYIYLNGREFDQSEQYLLCRCGHSSTMPFCDGNHRHINFDGSLTALHDPFEEQAEHIEGQGIILSDVKNLCAFARFCHRNEEDVWSLTEQSDDPNAREEAILAATECPAGRLVVRDKKTGEVIEPHYEEQSIKLLQDPLNECSGPLWVRGGIPVVTPDGYVYEVRNRMTLCRCGESNNKPFCDSIHVITGFSDQKQPVSFEEK